MDRYGSRNQPRFVPIGLYRFDVFSILPVRYQYAKNLSEPIGLQSIRLGLTREPLLHFLNPTPLNYLSFLQIDEYDNKKIKFDIL